MRNTLKCTHSGGKSLFRTEISPRDTIIYSCTNIYAPIYHHMRYVYNILCIATSSPVFPWQISRLESDVEATSPPSCHSGISWSGGNHISHFRLFLEYLITNFKNDVRVVLSSISRWESQHRERETERERGERWVVPQFGYAKLVELSPISLWFLLVIYRTNFHGIISHLYLRGNHLVYIRIPILYKIAQELRKSH